MAKIVPLPPRKYLNECFRYDETSGELFWKERPLYHFPSAKEHKTFNTQFSGRRVSSLATNGYLFCRLTINSKLHQVRAHRIIWKLHYCVDSGLDIDHIDRNKLNNRLENLREATRSQNNYNCKGRSHGTTGVTGVSFSKHAGKYEAYITVAKHRRHLGLFPSLQMAAEARASAEKAYFGSFCPTNREI